MSYSLFQIQVPIAMGDDSPLKVTKPLTNHVLGGITLLLGVVTVAGNLVALLAILKSQSRAMRQPHMILICCLAAVDLSIGVLHLVFVAVACFTGRWLDQQGELVEKYPNQISNEGVWCKISSFLTHLLLNLAISTVAVIGIERIITLTFPFKRHIWITKSRVILYLSLAWLTVIGLLVQRAAADHSTIYFMPAYQCVASYKSVSDIKAIILASMVFNFISFLIIIVASGYTIFKLVSLRNSAQNKMGEAKETSHKMIVNLIILILMCLDTSTWLPQYIAGTLRYFLPTSSRAFQTLTEYKLRTAVWWIQYLSPALNPVIYALRLKAVRNEISQQLRSLVRSDDNYPASGKRRTTNGTLVSFLSGRLSNA